MRTWLMSFLFSCMACSPGSLPSGSLSQTSDFLPVIADSIEEPSTSAEWDTMATNSDQPRLVLRCEEGRLGAYLVVGAPAEVETNANNERGVPIELDSAQSC